MPNIYKTHLKIEFYEIILYRRNCQWSTDTAVERNPIKKSMYMYTGLILAYFYVNLTVKNFLFQMIGIFYIHPATLIDLSSKYGSVKSDHDHQNNL